MTKAHILIAVSALAVFVFLAAASRGQDERAGHSHEHSVEASHGHEAAEDLHHAMDANEDISYESPRQQNFLTWLVGSLGWKYTLLLPVSALASFVLTGVLVVAGKGKTTGAAMAFVVAIPFLIGLFGTFEGLMSVFAILAYSTATPKPSELAFGIGTSIVTLPVGMLLMVPSYLLATGGLFVLALQREGGKQ